MNFDRVIANGEVFIEGTYHPVDLALHEGRIAAIANRGAFLGSTKDTIDATGKHVFPGVIDSHFHSRAPSHPERETFATATAAAAAGGVTALIEMPISEPPAINGEVLRARGALVDNEAHVHVGFYSSCATLRREDLESSIEAGALAFKGFLQQVPPGRESEFDGLCISTNAELLQAFELLADYDLPAVFHPEDESILKHLRSRLQSEGRRDGRAHAEHRPDIVEAIAVGTLIQLAERFDVHLHVPHVSSRMTVNLIRDSKARGSRITAESCPHYLQFNSESLESLGPYAVCNPPLKEESDRLALWEALIDGTIDTVASDHSPFTVAEKDRALDDIWLSPPGFPGVEVLAPFVIGASIQGKITPQRLHEIIFQNPARIFGLGSTRGRIAVGADADLMIYNSSTKSVFDHHQMISRAKGIGKIWDGVAKIGLVEATLLGGDIVFANGQVDLDKQLGRTLVRTMSQPSLSPQGRTR